MGVKHPIFVTHWVSSLGKVVLWTSHILHNMRAVWKMKFSFCSTRLLWHTPERVIWTMSDSRICAGCNAEIGHGRFLSCMENFWHPECFRCHACNLPISDYEVQIQLKHILIFFPLPSKGLISSAAFPYSSPCLRIAPTINPAIKRSITQDVMFARTL